MNINPKNLLTVIFTALALSSYSQNPINNVHSTWEAVFGSEGNEEKYNLQFLYGSRSESDSVTMAIMARTSVTNFKSTDTSNIYVVRVNAYGKILFYNIDTFERETFGEIRVFYGKSVYYMMGNRQYFLPFISGIDNNKLIMKYQ